MAPDLEEILRSTSPNVVMEGDADQSSRVARVSVPGPEAGKSRSAAQAFQPPWLVVIKRETYPPEVTPFDSEDEALAFAAEWGAQWTETYVCKVVKGPLT